MQPNLSTPDAQFNLCKHNYTVPTDDALLCSPALAASEIKQLSSMSDRIKAHEQRYLNNKDALLEDLKFSRQELHNELRERFFDSLQKHVFELQSQTEVYFASVIEHATLMCQAALVRLYIELTDEQKVKSVLQEVINDHQSEENVELSLPVGFNYDPSELPFPEGWKVSSDPNLAPCECRLKLGFGEVVGNFDESFKALYELVGGQ